MAGAFGYGSVTYNVSMPMAEASLLPPCGARTRLLSLSPTAPHCRHQIADGTNRAALQSRGAGDES